MVQPPTKALDVSRQNRQGYNMAEPKPPFYVSFSQDRIPTTVDHSRANPGPPGASRAGHTTAKPNARLTLNWDNGPTGADGRFPFFAQSINIFFRLEDFLVEISSNFSDASCAYKTTLRHELQAHIYEPLRIFYSYRDILIQRLNAVFVPTKTAPLRAASDVEAGQRQEAVNRQIRDVVRDVRAALIRDLEDARRRADAPNAYQLVYGQCTYEQWANGR